MKYNCLCTIEFQSPSPLTPSNPRFFHMGPAWFLAGSLATSLSLEQKLCEVGPASVWGPAGAPVPASSLPHFRGPGIRVQGVNEWAPSSTRASGCTDRRGPLLEGPEGARTEGLPEPKRGSQQQRTGRAVGRLLP